MTHLPNEVQTWLLRAALEHGDAARGAWDQWHRRTRWETGDVDGGSLRLLPLVYRSLARAAPDAPGIARLKGLYRRTWYENSRLLHFAEPALRSLVEAGHDVMVFKGVSLTLRHYRDRGVRSMADLDVLVSEGQEPAALRVLLGLGWTGENRDTDPRALLARQHGVNLVHPGGGRIDLHQRLLADSNPGDDGEVWCRARPLDLGGVRVLAPCAADELLLVCVHGWQWNHVPSIRWIHDAIAILQPGPEPVDWPLLVSEARRRRLSFRVGRALRVVRDQFGAPVPEDVLREIEAGPFAWFEQAEERSHTRAPGLVPPGLARAYFGHCREVGPARSPGWWVGCVRRFWHVRNPPSGMRLIPWLFDLVRRRVRAGIGLARTPGARGASATDTV